MHTPVAAQRTRAREVHASSPKEMERAMWFPLKKGARREAKRQESQKSGHVQVARVCTEDEAPYAREMSGG